MAEAAVAPGSVVLAEAPPDAPQSRARLQLKPRDEKAAKQLEAERQVKLRTSPFGDARPREAVLAVRTGRSEHEVLHDEAAHCPLRLSLTHNQLQQKQQLEGLVKEVQEQLQVEEQEDMRQGLQLLLVERQTAVDQLVSQFEQAALDTAHKGGGMRPSERRQLMAHKEGSGPHHDLTHHHHHNHNHHNASHHQQHLGRDQGQGHLHPRHLHSRQQQGSQQGTSSTTSSEQDPAAPWAHRPHLPHEQTDPRNSHHGHQHQHHQENMQHQQEHRGKHHANNHHEDRRQTDKQNHQPHPSAQGKALHAARPTAPTHEVDAEGFEVWTGGHHGHGLHHPGQPIHGKSYVKQHRGMGPDSVLLSSSPGAFDALQALTAAEDERGESLPPRSQDVQEPVLTHSSQQA